MRGMRSWRGRLAVAAVLGVAAVAGSSVADAAGVKRGGTLTMAKYGGWHNSLIPSWFSLITLSWLLLADSNHFYYDFFMGPT